MPRQTDSVGDDYGLTSAASWLDSCDWCDCQEGRHYCLLHGIVVKNMDVTRCPNWEPVKAQREAAS